MVEGRGIAIDRLISSHIRPIGTSGPTYNIRSKISAALNTLKFAPITIEINSNTLPLINFIPYRDISDIATAFLLHLKII